MEVLYCRLELTFFSVIGLNSMHVTSGQFTISRESNFSTAFDASFFSATSLKIKMPGAPLRSYQV